MCCVELHCVVLSCIVLRCLNVGVPVRACNELYLLSTGLLCCVVLCCLALRCIVALRCVCARACVAKYFFGEHRVGRGRGAIQSLSLTQETRSNGATVMDAAPPFIVLKYP